MTSRPKGARSGALEERFAGRDRFIEIDIRWRTPAGFRELAGAVDHVPRNHGLLALRSESDQNMSRRIAGRLFEPDLAAHTAVRIGEVDETRFPDRARAGPSFLPN